MSKDARIFLHRLIASNNCLIQIDFDDGNCPSWTNQLKGINNVQRVVHGKLEGKQ